MADSTQGTKPEDFKTVLVDAVEVEGKKPKGGFVAKFAADVKDAVIDAFKAGVEKVKTTGAAYVGATTKLADALDELAMVCAVKGRSRADQIKSGQQQTAYKEASKYFKEVLGLPVDSGAITQARYRARKAREEAAKKAARIAAGKEAVEPESPAKAAERIVKENIVRASKKDASFEDLHGAGNALVDKFRTVMPDACIAHTADGKLLKPEYVAEIRNLSALFSILADEYEAFVPKATDEDEELAATG